MNNWTLDQLKSQLGQRKEIKAWIITRENIQRRERYFMMDQGNFTTDQDREVNSQTLNARIFVNLSKAGRQGEISKKLFVTRPLPDQLDSAVLAALQTDHQAWELPAEMPKEVPQVQSTDPKMAEDLNSVMDQVTTEIVGAVLKKRQTEFNSAELFLSVHHKELHLSNQLIQRSSQSRVYVESAYSMTKADQHGKPQSDEYLHSSWAVSSGDISISKLFDEASERAEHSLDTQKPLTGSYPVIIDADVLATLFNGFFGQLWASNAYHKLPFIKSGEDLIPGATGDLLSVTLDPSLDFGGATTAMSDTGVVQRKIKIIENNRVILTPTDKQFSDYLGTPTTTSRGNFVVEGGKLTHQELTRAAPRVVEILQFSGLFMDSNSGTFSSEIRLAKLYDNVKGTVSYVKGGSLSGSIKENFKGAMLCKTQVKRAHFSSGSSVGEGYFGPEYALLSDVSIVG